MTDNNDTVDKLEKLKGFLVQLTAKKTKLESDGVVFEFSGELTEGTEIEFLEGKAKELTLEDGRTLQIEDNKVKSIFKYTEDDVVTELAKAISDEDEDSTEDVELESDSEENEVDEEMVEDEEEVEDEDADEADEDEMDYEERIAQLEEIIGEMKAKMDKMEEEHSTLIDSMTETVEASAELKEKVEKLSKSPAVSTDRKEITNSFNKTQNKSRAAQVLAAN